MLCWFLVSSLVPLIVNNDPVNDRCVGVIPLGSGSGFTADDRRLGSLPGLGSIPKELELINSIPSPIPEFGAELELKDFDREELE